MCVFVAYVVPLACHLSRTFSINAAALPPGDWLRELAVLAAQEIPAVQCSQTQKGGFAFTISQPLQRLNPFVVR